MLVCRHWYNSLNELSLFYDMEFYHQERFDKFMDLLRQAPRFRTHVEVLRLHISPSFDKRELCNILPKLRIVRFSYNVWEDPIYNHCSRSLELVYPHSKLEIIKDDRECELTRQLLVFGSCLLLRRLVLQLSWLNNPREDIFVHLKSAPALKELVLDSCKIGIKDCEIIHNNVPNLEVLNLDGMVLIPDEVPTDTIAATSVTKLHINVSKVETLSGYSEWYLYLAKKYTHLTNFSFDDPEMPPADADLLMKIYREGLFPIYKAIGKPLAGFNVERVPTETNLFKAMDEFDLQVTNFKLRENEDRPIFEQLAESKQSKHVESLDLEYTNISSPIMLQNFTPLTSLTIDKDDTYLDANLSDYLNGFPPSLTSFHACFCDAKIYEIPLRPNNIQEFYLTCTILPPKLADAISSCFPKLKDLQLRGSVEENLTLNLPNNPFESLVIIPVYNPSQPSPVFAVTNTDDPGPQYYTGHSPLAADQNLATTEEIEEGVHINIKYTTARIMFLHSTYSGRIM